jgi:vacuole morphology and inheritance protein 14
MKLQEEYCNILIERMLSFLFQRGSENESKVEVMIKKFIGSREAYKFLSIFCNKMQDFREKPKFMYDIANSLNAIIINEEVMVEIRKKLNNWEAAEYKELFTMLYQSLRYSPPAAISLCLLSQQYQLALQIINTLNGKYEISSNVLMGLCKLVSLL